MAIELQWESQRTLRDDLTGYIAAVSGIILAVSAILFSLGYKDAALLFFLFAVVAGLLTYKLVPQTIIKIEDDVLYYGRTSKVNLDKIISVCIKKVIFTDMLVIEKYKERYESISLQGVPSEVRSAIIEIIEKKIVSII